LGQEPKNRAWQALEGFQKTIENLKPKRILAGGTMVFRQASDGAEFMDLIGHRFGWETYVLTGAQEARLSALGVLSGLELTTPAALIFDVGGRSTEFIALNGRSIVKTISLEMGVVGLFEEFIRNDPPTPKELSAVKRKILSLLKNSGLEPLPSDSILVGTAGTLTTMAAMIMELRDYDGELVNNQVFNLSSVLDLLTDCANENLNERLKRPGLDPRRSDVIVPGLVEVASILEFFEKDRLTVSDNSLLEGLWLAAAGLAPLSDS
jgi:exopolyphosphatase/guanosine-5'-triphosphate,3'-diphosphate pyrophosphatase